LTIEELALMVNRTPMSVSKRIKECQEERQVVSKEHFYPLLTKRIGKRIILNLVARILMLRFPSKMCNALKKPDLSFFGY